MKRGKALEPDKGGMLELSDWELKNPEQHAKGLVDKETA